MQEALPLNFFRMSTHVQRGALPSSLLQPRYDSNRGAVMHNSAPSGFTPIKDITQYIGRWTIRGRCSLKSELRRYNKNGKAGCVFNFDLLDSSGEIRVVAFGDTAEKFEPQVKMGTFYQLSKASAKSMDPGKRKWNQTGHNCEVYLENHSEVWTATSPVKCPCTGRNSTQSCGSLKTLCVILLMACQTV